MSAYLRDAIFIVRIDQSSYICEISPPRHRAALTTGPQLLTTLGLVTGFFTCYGTTEIKSSISWRLPFILLAGYSFVFCAAVLIWLPPSPRWLTLHGKDREASAAWDRLDVPAADREKIMNQYDTAVVEAAIPDARGDNTAAHVNPLAVATPLSKKGKFLDLFSADARPRLFMAVFLMGMQQLSGIDGVLYVSPPILISFLPFLLFILAARLHGRTQYTQPVIQAPKLTITQYAPLLFQQAGLTSNESTFLASGVSAIVIFAVTIPATLFADRWGRRANTILGGLAMAATMFLMGSLYASDAVHAGSGAGRWVVIACIYVFAVLYCVSWAVGIKVYAAEIQPPRTRASATSIAHGSNWLANFLVALVTPTLLATTRYGAYFLFGGCLFVTAAVCWVFMPETRGLSLGEIDEAFRRGGRGVSGLKEWAKGLRGRVVRRMPAAVDA